MGTSFSRRSDRRGGVRLSLVAMWLTGLGTATFLVGGCEPAKTSAKPMSVSKRQDGRWNVILISIDTLRADRLSCYGYQRKTSPAIDRFAKRGVRFANVVSEASWTASAHMTLFTGLYPTTHGVTMPCVTLWEETPTLPQVLQQNGYRTFAYTGGGNVAGYYGFGRGFEHYGAANEKPNGDKSCALEEAIQSAQQRIESLSPDAPYFLFVHGYDVHAPYEPWEPWASRFKSPDAEPFEDYLRDAYVFRKSGRRLSPGNIKFLSDLYDAGVARADRLVGEFFEFLDRRGEFDRTVVIVLSDHGEEFGEHGGVGHYGTIYPECLYVPLIVVAPGLDPGVVEKGVGLKDVMPTVLQLVGLEVPVTQGLSLVSAMRAEEPDRRPLFSETDYGARLRSVIWDDHQLIRKAYDPTFRLFDLRSDPFGRDEVGDDHPELVAELMNLMPDPPDNVSALARTPRAADLDTLRSLGYIGGTD